MATKKNQDPDEVICLQVKPGGTAIYKDHAYGDRGTLQVRSGDLDAVTGKYTEVEPAAVPDVGERPAAA